MRGAGRMGGKSFKVPPSKAGGKSFDPFDLLPVGDLPVAPVLTPINDNWSWSKDADPADPRDCARYPASPYCGEVPFRRGSPFGVQPEIRTNGCETCIYIYPVILWLMATPQVICYRDPNCDKTPPPFDPIEKDKPPKYNENVSPDRYKSPECAERESIINIYLNYINSSEHLTDSEFNSQPNHFEYGEKRRTTGTETTPKITTRIVAGYNQPYQIGDGASIRRATPIEGDVFVNWEFIIFYDIYLNNQLVRSSADSVPRRTWTPAQCPDRPPRPTIKPPPPHADNDDREREKKRDKDMCCNDCKDSADLSRQILNEIKKANAKLGDGKVQFASLDGESQVQKNSITDALDWLGDLFGKVRESVQGLETIDLLNARCDDETGMTTFYSYPVQIIKGTGRAYVGLNNKLIAMQVALCTNAFKNKTSYVTLQSKRWDGKDLETRVEKFNIPSVMAPFAVYLGIELSDTHDDIGYIRKNLPKPVTTTSITGDISINDNWTIARGLRFDNPNNDKEIKSANQEANNLLATVVAAAKDYGVDVSLGNEATQASAGAIVPVGKSIIAVLPVIFALFKGLKLPTAILLDTIGGIVREIMLEQIKNKLFPKEQPIAAVPEWWQARTGSDRAQLVVLYAEKLAGNRLGRSRYAMTIPHYLYVGEGKPRFPEYQKGSWEGILVLNDNSKVIVNCISYKEASRVLNALKLFINPLMLNGSTQKIGERGGLPLKKITVKPVMSKFFATGQKDMNPTWVQSYE